jgi:2-polyprenyl-3-methyl-5-hydroxy-6-metoxy-1,4-benzoquinol methylase
VGETKNFTPPKYTRYHRDTTYTVNETLFKNIFTSRFKLLKPFLHSTGTVLDIGCSTGFFLDLFKNYNWKTYGVEPSESGSVAKSKGHIIFTKNFEASRITNSFDVILMNHTLEHLRRPHSIFQKIHSLLNPNGILYVDVPNFLSLSSFLLGSHWPYLLPNEHVFHYTKKALSILGDSEHFSTVASYTRSGIYEFASITEELADSLFHLKKRFVTHIVSFPYDTISTMVKRGDSISIIYKKQS